MKGPLYKSLYVQVLTGIVLGVVLGAVAPATGAAMKPLGDGFIKLIKMLIAPIVFATITVGIARMGAMRDVGRIGIRTLLYFEFVSTLALIIGLVVVNVLQPGARTARRSLLRRQPAAAAGAPTGTVDFLLNIIPTTVLDGFVRGDILQVLLVSLLFGIALLSQGQRAQHARGGDRAAVAHAVRHRRHDHAPGAHRRLRRDGLHGRPLRRSDRCSRWVSSWRAST